MVWNLNFGVGLIFVLFFKSNLYKSIETDLVKKISFFELYVMILNLIIPNISSSFFEVNLHQINQHTID